MAAKQIYERRNDQNRFDLENFKQIMASSKNNPVALYSITGPLRCGKSFMLSFFLKYLVSEGKPNWIVTELKEAFKYREGSESETTGIWMWSETFVRKIEGKDVSIFLLDTQECFDNLTNMSDNASVFALSALLSSCIIFNQKRQIDEGVLQFLQYFTDFARMANENNKEEPFQKLVFLLRDWEFPDYEPGYYDDNNNLNGKNYKIDLLNPNDKQPLETKCTHESILSSFEHISCYLLPHPGKAVSTKSIFTLETVEQDFLEHIQKFVPLILQDEKIVTKKIGGQELTGQELMQFVEKWDVIFQTKILPESKFLYHISNDMQNEKDKAAAIEKYTRGIKMATDGKLDEEFNLAHGILVEDCIELFKNYKRKGSNEKEDKYLESINECLQELYEYYFQINATQRESKEMDKQCKRLSADMQKQQKDFNDFEKISEDENKSTRLLMESNQALQERILNAEENADEGQCLENKVEQRREVVKRESSDAKYNCPYCSLM